MKKKTTNETTTESYENIVLAVSDLYIFNSDKLTAILDENKIIEKK